MAIVTIDDTNLSNIAKAIRDKNGSTDTYKPNEMANAISNIESGSGGGSEEIEALIKRTITSYSNDTITSIGAYAFHSCTKLTNVNLPKVTTIGANSFNGCSGLTSINIPLVTSINTQTFYNCDSLTTFVLPSLKTVAAQSIRHCGLLSRVDLGVCTSIAALSFDACTSLKTLIIRTSSVCTLANTSALSGTKIASGTGYIYVPDTLVEKYKSATNWSTYATQIKPLSELVV